MRNSLRQIMSSSLGLLEIETKFALAAVIVSDICSGVMVERFQAGRVRSVGRSLRSNW